MQIRTSEFPHFSCFFGKIPFHQQKTQGPMMLLLNHGRPGLVRLQDSLISGVFYHLSYIDLTYDNRCGNGLLTHILTSEGYHSLGIDVRARTSWGHYSRSTQASLKVHAFNPTLQRIPNVLQDGSLCHWKSCRRPLGCPLCPHAGVI